VREAEPYSHSVSAKAHSAPAGTLPSSGVEGDHGISCRPVEESELVERATGRSRPLGRVLTWGRAECRANARRRTPCYRPLPEFGLYLSSCRPPGDGICTRAGDPIVAYPRWKAAPRRVQPRDVREVDRFGRDARARPRRKSARECRSRARARFSSHAPAFRVLVHIVDGGAVW